MSQLRPGMGTYIIDWWESGFPYSSSGGNTGYNPNAGDTFTGYTPKDRNPYETPGIVPPIQGTPDPTTPRYDPLQPPQSQALVPYQSNLPATVDATTQQVNAAKQIDGVGLLVVIAVLAFAFGR